MLSTESQYYILKNIITNNGINLDFHIVKVGNLDVIIRSYLLLEKRCYDLYTKTFRNIDRVKNDRKDYWSFNYVDDKENTIMIVMCGIGKVRDFVTHI